MEAAREAQGLGPEVVQVPPASLPAAELSGKANLMAGKGTGHAASSSTPWWQALGPALCPHRLTAAFGEGTVSAHPQLCVAVHPGPGLWTGLSMPPPAAC